MSSPVPEQTVHAADGESVIRVPITPENAAAFFNGRSSSDLDGYPKPYIDMLGNVVVDGVRDMIYMFAWKYLASFPYDELEDLEQLCVQKIFDKLGRGYYDWRKVRNFSTWVWMACSSVLNGYYKKKRKKEIMVFGAEDLDNNEGRDGDPCLRLDIVETLRALMVRHPEHRLFLVELFGGDPFVGGYRPPSTLFFDDAARAIGVTRSNARVIFNKVVRPFFKSRMGETSWT